MSPRLFEPVQNEATRFVYPRLPRAAAREMVEERSEWPPDKLRWASRTSHPMAAPVRAGSMVPENLLIQVRDRVRTALDNADPKFDWPVPASRVAEFDRIVGRELYDTMRIVPADAASEGVWSFLTLILMPEIGPWRFPGGGDKRYLGVPRNVLRRTWWRAHALGSDLGGSSSGSPYLGEDELVQIFERPTLSANPWVARAIVSTIHRSPEQISTARSVFVRDLTRRLLRMTPLLCLDALSSDDLEALLVDLASQSAQALQRTGASLSDVDLVNGRGPDY
jgi:hypothetical protein